MHNAVMEKASQYCKRNGFRFTPPRELVLKILVAEGKPLGAYEILQKLSHQLNQPKPPTVYRAIQFWHKEGFIHCIDSLKSYIACSHQHHIGQVQFLVCTQCNFAQEIDCAIDMSSVPSVAKQHSFCIQNYTVEIKGLCAQCDTE